MLKFLISLTYLLKGKLSVDLKECDEIGLDYESETKNYKIFVYAKDQEGQGGQSLSSM